MRAFRLALIAVLAACSIGAAHARFLQTDPVGYEEDPNLYVYVGNDPLNRTDPTGRETNVLFPSQRDLFNRLDAQHAAVQVDNAGVDEFESPKAGTAGIYDPNGSRELVGPNGPENIAELTEHENTYVGSDATVSDYVATQFETYENIDAVIAVQIPTTPGQEAEVFQQAMEQGAGGLMGCSCSVSAAIGGVGPIPDMGTVWLPNDLRGRLQNNFPSTTYHRDGSVTQMPARRGN